MQRTEKDGRYPDAPVVAFGPFGKYSLNDTPEKQFFTYGRQKSDHEKVEQQATNVLHL
jgi:hypothetical protein